MAKPTLVAFTGSSEVPTAAYISSNIHPSRRRRRSSNSSAIFPSASILSFLATIASCDSAHASPTPPTFLCPSILDVDHNAHPQYPEKRHDSLLSGIAATPSNTANAARVIHRVPERYQRDEDGVYRRVQTYTLYGYTMGCTDGKCDTTTTPALDDQIQVGNPDATSSAIAGIDPTDLPNGWSPLSKVTTSRTTLILSMSLVLASFICFFIIGCLFWRKSLERRRKRSDIEAKARRRRRQVECSLTEEEVLEITVEQEMKTKQKLWARATARWKAHARQSARQRRNGKRATSRISHNHNESSTSLDRTRSRDATSHSSSQSDTSSRRSSVDSTRNDRSAQEDSRHDSPSLNPNTSHSASSSPSSNRSSSPPAYRHRTQVPSSPLSPDENAGMTTTTAQNRSRMPSHTSLGSPISTSKISTEPNSQLLTATPLQAHVATDDKALLARLAEMASAPPDDALPGGRVADEPQPLAPEWVDEDLDDFLLHDNAPRQPSAFPPPPSKERLAAVESYQYSLELERDMVADVELGPSAPPFEEGSGPPIPGGDNQLMPSAPPMEDDDSGLEYVPDLQPSAPQWEPSETAEAQNHDGLPVGSTPATMRFNASSPTSCSASDDANFPYLPGYRP